MPAVSTKAPTKSAQLLAVLAAYERCLIVMHDNPDPDAIATGWAILDLVEERLEKPCRLVGGGAIVRAENRHMVDLLSPPIELVDELGSLDGVATMLVDCGLGASNHLLTRQGVRPVAIVDHHANGNADKSRVQFYDLRPHVVASATIAASYLREQAVIPSAQLSTALAYAIRTETAGYEFHFSEIDKQILPWLTEHYEPGILAEIESAPLSRGYFADLALALQSSFLYGDVALCILPRAEGVEIVGEVADLLIRCQGIRCVLCGTVHGNDLVVSVRTCHDQDHAAKLLQTTLAGLGGGGGHDHRAGGKVVGVADAGKLPAELEDDLKRRWLAACQVNRRRGTRLVKRREIVDNL